MAGVMIAVPPEPPSPMTPATSSRVAMNARKAAVMAVTAWPRSPHWSTDPGTLRVVSRHGVRRYLHILGYAGGPDVDTYGRHACGTDQLRYVMQLGGLRVEGADDVRGAGRHGQADSLGVERRSSLNVLI
jgi:hypothetical protein